MKVERIGTVAVARLGPRYDAFAEEALDAAQAELFAATEGPGPHRVVMDFGETEYFSSAFIEVMFRVWHKIEKQPGGRMALAALQPMCRELLQATKLDTIWPVYPTPDEAIAALSADPAA
ncbi:MAG TPA: STAS domain-containing protein [Planctomycetia bacterium]|nr:STAS domain-containing protein [Planctomycetia bacterium]